MTQERPVEKPPHEREAERIARFRRGFAVYLATSFMLFVINMVTTPFPWFIFPVLGMGVGIVAKLGALWADGISMRRIFLGSRRSLPERAGQSARRQLAGLKPEILRGPHGAMVRRAVASQSAVHELLQDMSDRDRELLPQDLTETVDALAERVASIAQTVNRVDAGADGDSLRALDLRLEQLRGEPGTEVERRRALLERQRATLSDLLERRALLISQMENAALALDNLRLDLARYRSAGVSSALEEVTSATHLARAASRDIGRLLEAADEVRKM